jgi:rhomboid protease GluP
MQAAPAFGKRGQLGRRPVAPPPARPVRQTGAVEDWPDAASEIGSHRRLPFVTFALIIVLGLIYWAELSFAVQPDGEFAPGLHSLAAFGALNGSLVLQSGEWWRMFTAPLLHGNLTHILGNALALLFAGWILERVIGHAWFAALFVIGALGGAAGSLAANSPNVLSVGASGAIMALLGAALVCSFIFESVQLRRRMQKVSLRFLIPSLAPALLPLGIGTGTDFGAHIGGALAGAAMGFVLGEIWPEESPAPKGERFAAVIAVAGLLAAILSGFLAAEHYPHYASQPAVLMPESEIPRSLEEGSPRSADLVDRYPQDPRAHFYRAVFFLKQKDLGDAERELRAALTQEQVFGLDNPPGLKSSLNMMLALVLVYEGRMPEAKAMAGSACDPQGRELHELRAMLEEKGVCV